MFRSLIYIQQLRGGMCVNVSPDELTRCYPLIIKSLTMMLRKRYEYIIPILLLSIFTHVIYRLIYKQVVSIYSR